MSILHRILERFWRIRRYWLSPRRTTLNEIMYLRDGGTTIIQGWNGWWPIGFILAQNRSPDHPSLDLIPGRLYWGDWLVPVRSETEREIVALLRRCIDDLRNGPQPPDPEGFDPIGSQCGLLQSVIDRIESDEYERPPSRQRTST